MFNIKMKRVLFLLAFLLPVNSVLSDILNLKVDGQIRYFSTLVDDLGTRYDDTRPGPALDLHLLIQSMKTYLLKVLIM